jgi:2'-5' RNA ligase
VTHLQFPLRSAFIALPLEGAVKQRFYALQEELKPFEDFLRFQHPDSPHLTLYYWPTVLKIEYDAMIPQVAKIAERTSPFTLQINGVDTFGKAGDERVLFLTVAFSPELATLKKLCPWPNPPDQPFHPHITVARISHSQKFAVHRKQVMKVFNGFGESFSAEGIRLYAEVEGRKQTPLHTFAFGV